VKHSESIGNIAKALVEVQRELAPISKDSVNPHFKTKYASLDKLTEIVRPILCKHDIAIMQGGAEQDDKGVTVETKLLHSSGEWISGTYRLPMEKTNPQGAGSAITYARRYGLGSILALTTDDDDDANEASKTTAAATKAPSKTPATKPNGGQAARAKAACDAAVSRGIAKDDFNAAWRRACQQNETTIAPDSMPTDKFLLVLRSMETWCHETLEQMDAAAEANTEQELAGATI
jgi:hypothetical protein